MSRQLRRFNYTNRVKIASSDVHIDLQVQDGGPLQAAIRTLDLSDCGRHSPTDWDAAQVVLEARRLSTGSFHRAEVGSVASMKSSKSPLAVVPLEEFTDTEDITFRIKVVARDKRLLADGDRIRAGGNDRSEHEPLIEVYLEDLGEEVWQISWRDEELGPRVLVNRRLPYARGLITRDPLSKSIIVPCIVREVLFRIVVGELENHDWATKWLEFAERYDKGDLPDPEEHDAVQNWADNIVAKFATENLFATKAEEYLRTLGEGA